MWIGTEEKPTWNERRKRRASGQRARFGRALLGGLEERGRIAIAFDPTRRVSLHSRYVAEFSSSNMTEVFNHLALFPLCGANSVCPFRPASGV